MATTKKRTKPAAKKPAAKSAAKPAPKRPATKPAAKSVAAQSAAKKPAAAAPTAKPAKATAKSPLVDARARQLLGAIWANPDDVEALRVFADYLVEQGDSRGEYMQLDLLDASVATDAQNERARAILNKDRGAWLGAARPFIRSWSDGHPSGFVDHVWCEADKLLAGWDHFRWLGPKLVLSVTGMRKARRDTEARMAKLPLGEVYDLDLGANALDDKSITTLAPALRGSRALHIDNNEITRAGIAALGTHVTTLEYLSVGAAVKFSGDARTTLVDGIAEAIATTPGFRSLRYLHFFRTGTISSERAKQLHALPNMKRVSTSGYTEWSGRDPKSWDEERDDNI